MKSAFFLALILGVIILVCQPLPNHHSSIAYAQGVARKLNTAEFQQLVNTVSSGWNEGNAKKATSAFSDNAIYVEPPNKQHDVGREALFKFFGGDSGRPEQMQMVWHYLVFDEAQQLGVGEFTFRYGIDYQVHGTAMLKVTNGLISHWREYLFKSSLPWEENEWSQYGSDKIIYIPITPIETRPVASLHLYNSHQQLLTEPYCEWSRFSLLRRRATRLVVRHRFPLPRK